MGHLWILEQGQIQIPTLAQGGGSRGLHWLVHKESKSALTYMFMNHLFDTIYNL